MTNKLAENIKALRKEHSLTQERLAEALGVTTGAVYKWEAKLSQPDLNMIMAMADFFDTSVDVLLGYEMKDNNPGQIVERLKAYKQEKNREGLSEAEKAMKKYPNFFAVVYHSAVLYMVFGVETKEKALLQRALELFERSKALLAQNTDAKVNESTICVAMAEIMFALGETSKAVQLLKEHNAGGIYNDLIGSSLALQESTRAEAEGFLSDALLEHTAAMVRIVTGYTNVFFGKEDYRSGKNILIWGIRLLSGLRDGENPYFFDKVECIFLACLANAELKLGEEAEAVTCLLTAKKLAEGFDAAPSYDLRAVRFVLLAEKTAAYDDMGVTAKMGIENILAGLGDQELLKIWEEINGNEKGKKS